MLLNSYSRPEFMSLERVLGELLKVEHLIFIAQSL